MIFQLRPIRLTEDEVADGVAPQMNVEFVPERPFDRQIIRELKELLAKPETCRLMIAPIDPVAEDKEEPQNFALRAVSVAPKESV